MQSKLIPLCIFALFGVISAEKKIVCYFGDWMRYRKGEGKFEIKDIDPTLCTHVIYSFVLPKEDGTLYINDGDGELKKMASLKEKNPNVKLMIAVGGANHGSNEFTQIAKNPELRKKFVKNAVEYLKKYNLDGFDVDWEYPDNSDKKPFVELLKDLQTELHSNQFILSAAVAPDERRASAGYDIPEMNKYLDFINLMAYDLHGSWNYKTGHNAPLHSYDSDNNDGLNLENTIKYWQSQGASPEKLILGVPFYGRGFTLENPSETKPGSPASNGKVTGPYSGEVNMGYNEICKLKLPETWSKQWDDKAQVPYLSNGNDWLSYDDEKSIAAKTDFAMSNNLGGVMIWSIDTDDFNNQCNGGDYPLLRTINSRLGNQVQPSQSSQPEPPQIKVEQQKTPIKSTPQKTSNSNTNQQTMKSSTFTCSSAGNFADPNDKHIFHQCYPTNTGFADSVTKCSSNLVYNAAKNICDWN